MNIKVATTSRFRKTYRSFKRDEQKLIDEAIDLWLESPDNPSSNFEKLNFQASNIFSIRASKSWRIVMAKFDDMYFLLHAGGQHDKVNDWARTKKITRNSTTGAIQIFNTNVEVFDESLAQKADIKSTVFEAYKKEQLLAIGVPEDWVDAVKKVKDEEQFFQLWDYLPEDALENLQALYDGDVDIKILISQVAEESRSLPESTEDLVKVQPGFYVVSEDESLIEQMNQDINTFRFYLHPLQKHLAYAHHQGPMKVTGSAGTGKTVVAMHRAKYLTDQFAEGQKPILFTTYTKTLIKSLQSLFASQDIPEDKLLVENIHQYALAFGQELGLFPSHLKLITHVQDIHKLWKQFVNLHPEITWDYKFLQAEYKAIIQGLHVTTLEQYQLISRTGRGESLGSSDRKLVWEVLQKFESYQMSRNTLTFDDVIFQLVKYLQLWPEYRPFSHILCDEVQDFSNLELRLLRHLVAEGPNDLFLVGDPFQNIFQKRINFSQSGINIRGKRSKRLTLNYRTTEEIRRFAVKMLEGLTFEDFNGGVASLDRDNSIIHGNEPVYRAFNNRDEELTFILECIKDSFGEIGLHELCITARTNQEVSNMMNYFTDRKIPAVLLNDIDDISQASGHVMVCSMHSLKGLEFKNLIVTGLDHGSFPLKPKGFDKWDESLQTEYLKSEHALYYVAFSRAISNLVISGVGEKIERYQ